jgi:hypothetical protein
MAKIERQQAIKRVIDGLRLDTAREVVPSQVSPMVAATYSVNDPLLTNVVRSGNSASTGAITVYTVSSVKKFIYRVFPSRTKKARQRTTPA